VTTLQSASVNEVEQSTRIQTLSRLPSLQATEKGEAEQRAVYRVSDEQGATIAEMALACTILLAVVIGIFQMSLALYAFHFVSDAAREATRYAIVRGADCVNLSGCGATNAQIQQYVRNLGYPGITSTNLTVSTTWYTITMDTTKTPASAVLSTCGTAPAGCNNPGNQVQVHVIYKFPLNIPFWRSMTLNLSSTSAMVISQ